MRFLKCHFTSNFVNKQRINDLCSTDEVLWLLKIWHFFFDPHLIIKSTCLEYMKTCFKHQKFSSFSLSETDYLSQSASGYPVHANICISCVGPLTNNGIHAFQPCSHVLFCKDCCEKFTFPVMCPYCQQVCTHYQTIIVPTY